MNAAPVPGYEGLYTVTQQGKVYSVKRYGTEGGELAQYEGGRVGQYRRVRLWRRGKVRAFYVHRLVLLAFIGAPPPGLDDACHLNGDSTDNRLANLCWGSHADNVAHASWTRADRTAEELLEREAIVREAHGLLDYHPTEPF